MPFPPIDHLSVCVRNMLQNIHKHSDWIPRLVCSTYVVKTMITTKIMISENISQSTEEERRRIPLVHVMVRSYIKVVHHLTCSVLQFKLISVRHVITGTSSGTWPYRYDTKPGTLHRQYQAQDLHQFPRGNRKRNIKQPPPPS